MDLRSIANGVSSVINNNTQVVVLKSDGYSIVGAGRKQVPLYKTPLLGYAQIQALDAADLKQLDSLNIQGTIRAAYFRGALAGVIRPTGVGGDLVRFANQTWLVVRVLESWPNWTKVAIVLQEPSPEGSTIYVTTDPGATDTSSVDLGELTFVAGVPSYIYVFDWTAVQYFTNAILAIDPTVDGSFTIDMLVNENLYLGAVLDYVTGTQSGFSDSNLPAATGAGVSLTINTDVDVTVNITLRRGDIE